MTSRLWPETNLFAGLKTQNKRSLESVEFAGPTRSSERVNAVRAAGRAAHIESETQSNEHNVDVAAARNGSRYDLTRIIVALPILHAPELSRKLKLK